MSDFDRCKKLRDEYDKGNITSKEMQERCCEMLEPQQALKFGMPKTSKSHRTLLKTRE
jgi:hypothetical protein